MKMEIIGPFILSIISGLSTLLGTLLIFLKPKKVGEYITFFLSFSMSIMMIVSIFDMIPSSLIKLIYNYGLIYGIIISILVFFLGYQLVYFINKKIKYNESSLYKIGIISMISLILHNLPEGMIVFMSSFTNIKFGLKLCISIILHNIPEGISIALPLYYSKESRGKVFFYTLLAAISEPIGALLSYVVLGRVITDLIISYILLFVAGIMISLSINDIYIEIKEYNNKKYIIYGVILAIILSLLLNFI